MDYIVVQDITGIYFDQAMIIYNQAFPPNERQSIETIKNRIINGQSQLRVGIIHDCVVVIALLWDFQNSPLVLLDYLAVKKGFEGQHIGSVMFQKIIQEINKRGKQFLIIEVEHVDFGNNRKQRQKRLNFYFKNGAHLLSNLQYHLPSLNDTEDTEMHLMISPKPSKEILEKESIENLIQRLYVEIYQKEDNNIGLITMLKKLPKQIKLTNS